MLREFLEPAGLFLSPFLVFAFYLVLRLRYPLAVEHWSGARVSVLTLIGLAVAVFGMLVVGLTAPRGRGVYTPAHVEGGKLVPGRID
jgi:Family of unknown function (DUF6111)